MKFLPILLIILAVLARLLPHPPNFAPIAALALFGAVYLPRGYGLGLPLLGLFLGDLILGFYGLEMLFVYGSFGLISLVGLWLSRHKQPQFILGSSLLGSILFFLITNFGVWLLPNSMYSKDLEGLKNCFIMALPFIRGTILGDLTYTLCLFGGYELAHFVAKRHLSTQVQKWLF